MSDITFLANSKNKIPVYVDLLNSHAATHFKDTPQLKDLAQEIIGNTDLNEEVVEFEIDMGRIVGDTDGVTTDEGDKIVYAKRKNRETFTPFNKTKKPEPCSIVSISMGRQSDGTYILQSAWIGTFDSPPFPGDEHETPESKPYWTKNSLAWGTQEIQADTLTTKCPW